MCLCVCNKIPHKLSWGVCVCTKPNNGWGWGVRRTQYRWNWEWGIKGGGGRHNIGGWVGVGAWGRGHAVPVELGGGGR